MLTWFQMQHQNIVVNLGNLLLSWTKPSLSKSTCLNNWSLPRLRAQSNWSLQIWHCLNLIPTAKFNLTSPLRQNAYIIQCMRHTCWLIQQLTHLWTIKLPSNVICRVRCTNSAKADILQTVETQLGHKFVKIYLLYNF